MTHCFDGYDVGEFYDEMFLADGTPRPGTRLLHERLTGLGIEEVARRQRSAERLLLAAGITFNVYGHDAGTEKIFPFDVVPRIVPASEWAPLEAGLRQRIEALNLFVADIYGAQRIIKDGVIPAQLIADSQGYLPQCRGLTPPRGVWIHITGTDLVRDQHGVFRVLEDNLRCPSGVSYVLENRALMKRTFPQVFEASHVRPADEYAGRLLRTLHQCAPPSMPAGRAPRCVVLTPGMFNSAYFEHSFLAKQMGVELVEGRDLLVSDDRVYMRTTKGLSQVDVIYRRIDDTFIDPEVFNPESLLGVPGLMRAYRAGNVALANAPGTGVADDKVIYAFVPQMIEYYLGQPALLPNVETYVCAVPEQRAYVLANLSSLVVKAANGAGGYGMLMGPSSTPEEREAFAVAIAQNPRNYIAQPVLGLSRVPTLIDESRFEGRHVDLRPYILYGDEIYVQPGGLTRVALRKGSLVVNSSQGGGSKDTWVLYDDGPRGP
jgi:uncharacterized circularly permuted ATP-grasp superfamily protein